MITLSSITLAAAAPAAESGSKFEDITTRFGVHWDLFLSQLIAFLVVCFVLKRFAYEPVMNMLEERRTRIESGEAKLEKIERQLEDSEKTTAELIAKANADAERLINEAKDNSARLSEQKSQEALATAKGIIHKAEEAAKAEREKMAAELKKEFGQLVVQTTAAVTGKTLNKDDQKRLNQEALSALEKN